MTERLTPEERVRKEDEVRYVPIPHPEDLRAWLQAAYEAGRQDGAQSLPEVTA
jgi:hypothetical protein